MASGTGGQPPALPVKQHRSNSSRCSSVESACVLLSPLGPNYPYNDVFLEPTDCHAAQCPIHQRYDPSQHQARFFSDGTPPAVPKKRLARTLSLPVVQASPLTPLPPPSPLPRQTHNFDNPLYMMAPKPDIYFREESIEFDPVRDSPIPSLSLSQLSFDTPDEDLLHVLGSLDDQEVVFQGIQHCYLLFLRNMAQKVEAGVLLQREATDETVRSYQPEDFLLCEDSEPKQIRNTVYYRLQSPRLPGRILGLRVHDQTDDTASVLTKHHPSHVNVRDIITHFQPRSTLKTDSGKLRSQGFTGLVKSDCTAAEPPGGDSADFVTDGLKMNVPSVQSFLQRGCSVSVERDLPHTTLEEFVQENHLQQSKDYLDYDRQVCVLMLQVLMGLQHLYNASGAAADLRPQEIFLVWPNGEKDDGEKKDASRGNRGCQIKEVESQKGKTQMLWRIRGSPRVVLAPLSSVVSTSHPLTFIKSQINNLIQYCFNPQESAMSSYRTGLLHLSSLLHNERRALQVPDMIIMLQVLLWGPRVPLFNHRGHVTTAVNNWLILKRALLVMKFAERGLIQVQSALDWEDCMRLQYLSFTDPEIIGSMAGQLWLTVNLE
ncbi:inactive tyrosine-protein kinase PRAG1 [Xyrichtys novacula]|uniref:Inactive tyrosine-protein kinase PRAG1 n=1 Tax=Xyrichtys novacula TaxID=13765 RepID=A0AAV1FH13_XYRNO|nr:inactive tyrosine-protein kinase PRAG1 [Xyrichtys novacula]